MARRASYAAHYDSDPLVLDPLVLSRPLVRDLVASLASAARQLHQQAFLKKVGEVASRRGFRDLGDRLVFRGGDAVLESSFAAVKQTVDHLQLLGKQ